MLTNIGSLTGLANALVELQLNDEALAIYHQLLENNPNHVGALVGRANLLFEARRYEQALPLVTTTYSRYNLISRKRGMVVAARFSNSTATMQRPQLTTKPWS